MTKLSKRSSSILHLDFAVISKVASLGDITGYSLQLAKDEGTTRG